MKDFHLLGEELFKPLVFRYIVLNELDGKGTGDLDSSFSLLSAVEPCLCPPDDAVTVRIDTDGSLYVEALDINLKVCQRVNDALALYSPVRSFFFSNSVIEDRKTLCFRAR